MIASSPSIPDGIILYAIGDIHGRADKLRELLTIIEKDAKAQPHAEKRVVSLGDYIDRGPDSKDVIDILLHGLPEGIQGVCLRGNHEESAISVLNGNTIRLESWLFHGGNTTLASYGIDVQGRLLEELRKTLPDEFARVIPQEHREFLESTIYTYECGDYFFVHAGARPGVALARQSKRDLISIRDDFLSSAHDFGKIIVHGHEITDAPDIQPTRIGIDTGAYATGRLTCLRLQGATREFLMT